MSDRFLSLVLLMVGLIYGAAAQNYGSPFSYDPLGPKPVPLFLAGTLIVLTIILLFYPHQAQLNSAPVWGRVVWLSIILLFYQLSWNLLGFLLATTISIYLVSRLYRCSWMQGLMTALILSVICYGLFNFLLNTPLPLGTIFTYGID